MYKEQKTKLLEFIRFGIVGTLAVGVHYGLFYVLLPYMEKNLAFSIGYAISRVKPSWPRFLKFGTSHGINYVLNIVLFNLFCWLGIPVKWAPLPVYAVAVPLNFLLVRFALTKKLKRGRKEPSGIKL